MHRDMELEDTRPVNRIEGLAATVACGMDTLPAVAGHAPRTTLDARYTAEGELARGGMGRILRARDNRLGRPLAIKQLLHDDPELPGSPRTSSSRMPISVMSRWR